MNALEQTIFCVIAVILLVALGVMTFENGRKIDNLTAQLKAMRQDMTDAGYISAEPKISGRIDKNGN